MPQFKFRNNKKTGPEITKKDPEKCVPSQEDWDITRNDGNLIIKKLWIHKRNEKNPKKTQIFYQTEWRHIRRTRRDFDKTREKNLGEKEWKFQEKSWHCAKGRWKKTLKVSIKITEKNSVKLRQFNQGIKKNSGNSEISRAGPEKPQEKRWNFTREGMYKVQTNLGI